MPLGTTSDTRLDHPLSSVIETVELMVEAELMFKHYQDRTAMISEVMGRLNET